MQLHLCISCFAEAKHDMHMVDRRVYYTLCPDIGFMRLQEGQSEEKWKDGISLKCPSYNLISLYQYFFMI